MHGMLVGECVAARGAEHRAAPTARLAMTMGGRGGG